MRIPAMNFEIIAYTDLGLRRNLNEDFFCSLYRSPKQPLGDWQT